MSGRPPVASLAGCRTSRRPDPRPHAPPPGRPGRSGSRPSTGRGRTRSWRWQARRSPSSGSSTPPATSTRTAAATRRWRAPPPWPPPCSPRWRWGPRWRSGGGGRPRRAGSPSSPGCCRWRAAGSRRSGWWSARGRCRSGRWRCTRLPPRTGGPGGPVTGGRRSAWPSSAGRSPRRHPTRSSAIFRSPFSPRPPPGRWGAPCADTARTPPWPPSAGRRWSGPPARRNGCCWHRRCTTWWRTASAW